MQLMQRFESQVEEVKARSDIVGIIGGYVNLKKAGRNYKGTCPFHGEKTPSFMVSPDRQIFKCFGCSEGGDVFAFIQKIEGVEFGEALRNLAAKAGIQLKEYKQTPAEKQKEVINEINTAAANFYNFLLTKHPSGKKALEYLNGRGVNEKTIKEWLLGWAPESWDNAFKYLSEKRKFSKEDIIASGISLPGQRQGAYDRFRKRIMFPIRNISGQVVGFSGRILGEGEPKYLNSSDNSVFNKSNNLFGLDLAKTEIKTAKEAVLVEGNLDAISSHQAGVKNVVAPLGTALTEKQVALLKRFSETLVISFDEDFAGQNAARRAIDLAEKSSLMVKVIQLEDKDPDELIRRDPSIWKQKIKEAVPVYEYLINSAIRRNGTRDSGAINKITREVIPFIARIDNDITKSHYERLLAEKLGVSEASVNNEIKKVGTTVPQIEEEKTKKIDKVSLEKYLLALVLQTKLFPKDFDVKDVEDAKLRSVFELAFKEDNFNPDNFSEKLPEELEDTFNEVSLLELPTEILVNEDKIRFEIDSCTSRLKELNLRTKLKALSLGIKQAEINKKPQDLEELSKTFKVLSQQLSSIEKVREGD